jgi:serine/threonine protein kinase
MTCYVVQAMLLRRCADVAAGLGYLHSRNVCHGDLKLENVLLRTGVCGAQLGS